jgi:hypothetical protein
MDHPPNNAIDIWLVVYQPLWTIWYSQLGWWNFQHTEGHKSHVPTHQPDIYVLIHGIHGQYQFHPPSCPASTVSVRSSSLSNAKRTWTRNRGTSVGPLGCCPKNVTFKKEDLTMKHEDFIGFSYKKNMYKAKWWLNHNQGWFQSRKMMIQRRMLMNLLKKTWFSQERWWCYQ